jgi:predicted RNase H-like nuclease
MAERMIVVCDVCGQPAMDTARIQVGGRRLTKDLCQTHLSEFTSGARPARRGRPRATGTVPASKRSKRTTGVAPATKDATAKRSQPKKASARRRTRRSRKSTTAAESM